MIRLENGLKRKKLIYVSYNDLERKKIVYVSLCGHDRYILHVIWISICR